MTSSRRIRMCNFLLMGVLTRASLWMNRTTSKIPRANVQVRSWSCAKQRHDVCWLVALRQWTMPRSFMPNQALLPMMTSISRDIVKRKKLSLEGVLWPSGVVLYENVSWIFCWLRRLKRCIEATSFQTQAARHPGQGETGQRKDETNC